MDCTNVSWKQRPWDPKSETGSLATWASERVQLVGGIVGAQVSERSASESVVLDGNL